MNTINKTLGIAVLLSACFSMPAIAGKAMTKAEARTILALTKPSISPHATQAIAVIVAAAKTPETLRAFTIPEDPAELGEMLGFTSFIYHNPAAVHPTDNAETRAKAAVLLGEEGVAQIEEARRQTNENANPAFIDALKALPAGRYNFIIEALHSKADEVLREFQLQQEQARKILGSR